LLWDKLKAVERQYFRLNEKEQVEQAKFEEVILGPALSRASRALRVRELVSV